MALTNYQRQKRWREKNRVIYNLRRRNARKNLSGGAKALAESGGIKTLAETETNSEFEPQQPSSIRDAAQNSKDATLANLRELVAREHERVVDEPVKPTIFRNDYGASLSERAWNQLQEKKRRAKEGGYVLDEYSQ